jgi:hypothetical protein
VEEREKSLEVWVHEAEVDRERTSESVGGTPTEATETVALPGKSATRERQVESGLDPAPGRAILNIESDARCKDGAGLTKDQL